MTLLRPNARIDVEGQVTTVAEGGVWRLRISLSTSMAHDRAMVGCWPGSRLRTAAPGASMTLELGETGEETLVWSGVLEEVQHEPATSLLTGLSHTHELSRLRTSRSYLDQSVSDIVSDLASDTDVDEIESSISLPAYHLDDRRSAWSHIHELARLAGAEVGSSPSGGLRFVSPRSGSPDHTFRYGAEVLAWQAGPRRAPAPAQAVAHGAGSEAGADRWHWLRRDLGAGEPPPRRTVAAFSTLDAADHLTTALEARATSAGSGGRLTITGSPGVRPGELLAITGLPNDADPGTLRALAVEHVLDGRAGFVTRVLVEGAGT